MLQHFRKLMLAIGLTAGVLLFASPTATAQPVDCYTSLTLTMSCDATHVADSMWAVGQTNRTEVAMCVTQWDTVGGRAHIQRLMPTLNIVSQDSLHVRYDKTICDDSLPNIHTHFLHVIAPDGTDWRYIPSPADSEAFKNRRAAFYVLMSNVNVYRVYK